MECGASTSFVMLTFNISQRLMDECHNMETDSNKEKIRVRISIQCIHSMRPKSVYRLQKEAAIALCKLRSIKPQIISIMRSKNPQERHQVSASRANVDERKSSAQMAKGNLTNLGSIQCKVRHVKKGRTQSR